VEEVPMSHHPDFAILDRHVLRAGYGALLDLPLVPEPGSKVWVATIWPDPNEPGGWGRLLWERNPAGRGWLIHPLTHLGDVIESGADHDGQADRWYGYVSDASKYTIVLVGPYMSPSDAATDGRGSLSRWAISAVRGQPS
jgi:hypothetical protein